MPIRTPGFFHTLACAVFITLCTQLVGCGGFPVQPQVQKEGGVRPESAAGSGAEALRVAQQMLGVPYRNGGAGPAGFDCSGLVAYSYAQTGVALPRTAREQYAHTRPVSIDELRPGDLVFFRLKSSTVSHVGIYQGTRKFIHAPATGKAVMIASLDNRYWRERWVRGGRIPAPSS